MSQEWKVSALRPPFTRYLELAGESLHYYDAAIWDQYVERVGPENLRGVYNGETLAGGLAFYRMGQWFGGRCVPCAGLSGVAIDPGYRGTGACKTLLVSWLDELHAEQTPLAALYASTKNLYRSVGFEQAGHRLDYAIPMESLTVDRSARQMPVTRIAKPMPGDAKPSSYQIEPHIALLKRISAERNQANNGLLERTDGQWERVIDPIGATTTSTYILGGLDQPQGYVVLHHNHRSGGHPHPLTASDWVANSPAAFQRMLALVRDHRSMCDRFQWIGGPQDPLLMLASEERVEVTAQIRTMNRIVDLPRALSERGYPKHPDLCLNLAVQDDLLSKNSGYWQLRLQDGRARVTQIASADSYIQLGIDALVPLYTSLMTASQLRSVGKLTASDSEAVELADLIFAGPAPWTNDMF